MPFLRINHLGLRVQTVKGLFGVDIPFTDGLNVIRAENTAGKSTSMMSILYALGLEGMLGPSQNPPLPAAMKEKLQYNGSNINVLESQALLEISNASHDVITLARKVTGTPRDRQLIRVFNGAEASSPTKSPVHRDFYVRAPRSAQADVGFHTFLAKFLGLNLPRIPKSDGPASPLYLECVFPYFFVEQLTGWRDIKSRMPTFLQIPEMSKRAAEFVLNLDILRLSIRLQELEVEEKSITDRWNALRKESIGVVGFGVVPRGIPDAPVVGWPRESMPKLFITDGGDWFDVAELIRRDEEKLQRLVQEELPRAQTISVKATALLRELNTEYGVIETRYGELQEDIRNDQSQLAAVFERLQALKEDRRKYQDEKRLRERGGVVKERVVDGKCPVCDRPVNDTLLSQLVPVNPMSIEDNILFLNDQISTFDFMLNDIRGVLRAKEERASALVERMHDVANRLRTLNETLRSHGEIPSAAAIRDRIRLEDRLARLRELETIFAARLASFSELIESWKKVQDELKSLRNRKFSVDDGRKLDKLEGSFKSQLKSYGFTSYDVDVDEVGIGRESYRPSQSDYDLGFTSASDTIRTIWAYLLGILEVARTEPTNHLGFLLFDEPKQQSAKDLSFEALLKRAAQAKSSGQQVIFATSQEERSLLKMLVGLDATYRPFPDKMIRPL